jgi:hypothetical protein
MITNPSRRAITPGRQSSAFHDADAGEVDRIHHLSAETSLPTLADLFETGSITISIHPSD